MPLRLGRGAFRVSEMAWKANFLAARSILLMLKPFEMVREMMTPTKMSPTILLIIANLRDSSGLKALRMTITRGL